MVTNQYLSNVFRSYLIVYQTPLLGLRLDLHHLRGNRANDMRGSLPSLALQIRNSIDRNDGVQCKIGTNNPLESPVKRLLDSPFFYNNKEKRRKEKERLYLCFIGLWWEWDGPGWGGASDVSGSALSRVEKIYMPIRFSLKKLSPLWQSCRFVAILSFLA